MSAPILRYFSGTSQVSPLNSNVFVNRDDWSADHAVYQRSPIDDYDPPLDPLQREHRKMLQKQVYEVRWKYRIR